MGGTGRMAKNQSSAANNAMPKAKKIRRNLVRSAADTSKRLTVISLASIEAQFGATTKRLPDLGFGLFPGHWTLDIGHWSLESCSTGQLLPKIAILPSSPNSDMKCRWHQK